MAPTTALTKNLSRLTSLTLNPVMMGPLLWLLQYGPPTLRVQLAARWRAIFGHERRVLVALRMLLVVGVVRVVNRKMNSMALNGWRLGSDKGRWDWQREVAVVTGGCSGIGRGIVLGLAGRGVKVAVWDVVGFDDELAREPNVTFFECDITKPEVVAAVAEAVQRTLGSPSILVNNAGILDVHGIMGTSHEYLRKIFDVNVLSNWTTVRALLPAMVAQNKGHIVTVASQGSYAAVAGLADYTATKAAILAFHETLNQELKLIHKTTGVLTTSVHPGWVRTPLIAQVMDEINRRRAGVSEPAEVADAVVNGVMSCRGGQVFLPKGSDGMSALRALPNWLQEHVRTSASRNLLDTIALKG